MNHKYTIKLPTEYLESLQKEDFEKELDDVQAHFDDNAVQLEEGFISFVFLKGLYSHMNRLTSVVGVFVNTLPDEVLAFRGRLKLRHIDDDNFGAEADIIVQNESIGELRTNEGMFVYLDMPTQGVAGNAIFEADEIEAIFADIEYARLCDEASEKQ